MPTKKVRLLSVTMAGGLVFTGLTATAIANTGHAHTRAALTANMASLPSVNLDNCPTLQVGYFNSGCVTQLQTDLNADNGTNMPVDGVFGPATQHAVIIFQQNHHVVPADGIAGPQTKAALDNPGSNPAATPTPGTSGGSGAANTAAPASGTDPGARIELAAGGSNCVDYSQGAIWQTSSSWVRARYRFCLPESSDGTIVQPIVQVQFDWPNACSLTVGFPPSAGISCPVSTLFKQDIVTFQAYTNINNTPITFRTPLTIQGPNGTTYSGWCNFGPTNISANTREYRAATGDRPTLTCRGPQFERLSGIYTVSSPGPRGDVKNDGDSERILTGGAFEYVSP